MILRYKRLVMYFKEDKRMNYKDLPMIGKPTEEELEMQEYLANCIDDYIEKKPTDRRVLIAALSSICTIVFTRETPWDKDIQKSEITSFCEFLLNKVM